VTQNSQGRQGRYVFQPTAGTAQALRFSTGVLIRLMNIIELIVRAQWGAFFGPRDVITSV
jgi:hypothetical protein